METHHKSACSETCIIQIVFSATSSNIFCSLPYSIFTVQNYYTIRTTIYTLQRKTHQWSGEYCKFEKKRCFPPFAEIVTDTFWIKLFFFSFPVPFRKKVFCCLQFQATVLKQDEKKLRSTGRKGVKLFFFCLFLCVLWTFSTWDSLISSANITLTRFLLFYPTLNLAIFSQ